MSMTSPRTRKVPREVDVVALVLQRGQVGAAAGALVDALAAGQVKVMAV
jgi:hypothetical protein